MMRSFYRNFGYMCAFLEDMLDVGIDHEGKSFYMSFDFKVGFSFLDVL